MNLIATSKIVWTVPVPAKARRLYKALQQLSADDTKGRTEIEAELPMIEQYRLTLTTVTMTEEPKRELMIAEIGKWFEEQHGLSPFVFNRWYIQRFIRNSEVTDIEYPAGENMSRREATDIFGQLRDIADWATLMVCLKSVEYRKVKMGEESPTVQWHERSIPDEWIDYHTFRDSFPRNLFADSVEICNDLNPGVWGLSVDEEAKNIGGVSVNW